MERLKSNGKFKLTPEEASAIIASDLGAEVTSYMESVIGKVFIRADEAGLTILQLIENARNTDGLLIGKSFGEGFFRTPEEIAKNKGNHD